MLSEIQFESTIQIVFKYLNTNISIYQIDSLEECEIFLYLLQSAYQKYLQIRVSIIIIKDMYGEKFRNK